MLIVMAKAPTRGQTKTRLGGLIGLDAAADFYRCLLTDVVALARRVPLHLPDVIPAIGYWPAEDESFFREFVPDFAMVLQHGEQLGDLLPTTADIDTPDDVQRLIDQTHIWPDDLAPHTRQWLTQWQTQP